jgi:hypothetical protein
VRSVEVWVVIFGLLISLLPLIISVLVLLHIIRTLDAIRIDVRRIADRVDTPQRTQSAE